MSVITQELREKLYRLCSEFMGGAWSDMDIDDLYIEYISGGLSNLLYLCAINSDKIQTKDEEARKVMIRLYGKIIQENPETVVTDSVIFSILAERGIGPRLLGVFTEGRVEEYIPSRHLSSKELSDPAISQECARRMSEIHQLQNMPLCKQPKWLFTTMQRYLDEAMNNLTFQTCEDMERASKLQRLANYNLAAELKCLRTMLSRVPSPVVFCHNDYQEGNILIFHEGKKFKLMPIDFEYAAYNYRGFDFGNHFCEWCYDYHTVEEPPYYTASIDLYPTREQQLAFMRAYLDEAGGIEADGDPGPVEEAMLLEAHVFALASHFLWGLWSIVQANISGIRFHYLDYALVRFEHYFYQKAQLPPHIQEIQNSQATGDARNVSKKT